MSTKIYTGFRFTTSSWTTVYKHIMAFRHELKALAGIERAKKLAEYTLLIVDRKAAGIEPPDGQSAYTSAVKDLWTEQQIHPITFTISVFPYGRRIYGITFGWLGYEVLWHKKPFVQQWGYWNNVDRPDDVSAREWQHRRDVWNKILGDSSPAMTGFTADCVDQYETHVKPEELLEHVPDLESRIRAVVADLLFPEYKQEHGGEGLSCYVGFQQWLRGDGSPKFQKECHRVKMFLPRKVTKEMILDGEVFLT